VKPLSLRSRLIAAAAAAIVVAVVLLALAVPALLSRQLAGSLDETRCARGRSTWLGSRRRARAS
jgi:hypothetical protein